MWATVWLTNTTFFLSFVGFEGSRERRQLPAHLSIVLSWAFAAHGLTPPGDSQGWWARRGSRQARAGPGPGKPPQPERRQLSTERRCSRLAPTGTLGRTGFPLRGGGGKPGLAALLLGMAEHGCLQSRGVGARVPASFRL